ncbi:hypothetical protein FHU41_001547 [Psychromicrobium silvestre]|uniref:Uncharacterized protein n=1 Tax=Psychromicrobium silvestre TaxID=1645614 RepID=A0A7Y9LTK4_9MICC|nr:hypothetical protein [Psychromicrobium silvestre]NYE95326.1 hypothetical protein [Psychromicrobium silvestre]
MFEIPIGSVIFTLGAAIFVYLLLRYLTWRPVPSDRIGTARGHAFWTGVIAFFASGFNSGSNPGQLSYPLGLRTAPDGVQTSVTSIWLNSVVTISWPLIAFMAVYLISQFTFPKPRGTVRNAELSRRRVTDFIPRNLAIFAALVLATSGFLISGLLGLPGFDSYQHPNGVQQAGVYESSTSYPGRMDGTAFATVLWAGLALLVLGTGLLLWCIARRRNLEGLSTANNSTLRSISMNRLLRTTVLASCGLVNSALQYTRIVPDHEPMQPLLEPTLWGISSNAIGLSSFLIFAVLLFWRPPTMDERNGRAEVTLTEDPAQLKQLTMDRVALTWSNMVRLSLVVPILLLLIIGIFLTSPAPPSTTVAAAFWLIIGAACQLFLLIGEVLLWRWYGVGEASRQTLLPPQWLIATMALCTVLFVVCLSYNSLAHVPGDGTWAHPILAAFLLLALTVTNCYLAAVRAKIAFSSELIDGTLRKVTAFRATRLAAAGLCASSAQLLTYPGPPDQPQIAVVGAVILAVSAVILAVIPGPTREIPGLEPFGQFDHAASQSRP